MAENLLIKHFGLSRPWWIDPAVYDTVLFPMNKPSAATVGIPVASSVRQEQEPHKTIPSRFVMAAPYTPFTANQTLNLTAIDPLAAAMPRWGINSVFVMGGKGQFDALTLYERKAVASKWVEQGHLHSLYIVVHVGSCVRQEAEDLARYCVEIGADAIASIGPYCELVDGAKAVADYLAPVARAAGSTPFWYYHTPGTNTVTLNNVNLLQLPEEAEKQYPHWIQGAKFESRNLTEWAEVLAHPIGQRTKLVWAEGHDLEHFSHGGEGHGAYVPEPLGPSYVRLTEALQRGDQKAAEQEHDWATSVMELTGDSNGAPERVFFKELCSTDLGPYRAPAITPSEASLKAMGAKLRKMGYFDQQVPTTMNTVLI